MTRLIVLVVIHILLSKAVQGQNPIADSLEQVLLQTHESEDRMDLLGRISWAYLSQRTELEKGKWYSDSLKRYSLSQSNPRWHMRTLFYDGAYERFKGNHTAAIAPLTKYIDYFTVEGDSNWVADGLFQLAVVQHHLGNDTEALKAYYRIIEIDRSMGLEVNVAHSLNSIGSIHSRMLKYEEALKVYQEALAIYERAGREANASMVYTNIANVLKQLRRYEEAGNLYHKALKIDRKTGIRYSEAYSLANLAFLHDAMKDYDSGLYYHLAALHIREELPNKDDYARSLIGVGRAYRQAGNLPLANQYLTAAMEVVHAIQSKPMIRDVYHNLADLHEARSDYKQSLYYYRLFKQMNDSLLNEENLRQLNELNVRYETENKNNRISLLENENLMQKQLASSQAFQKNVFIASSLLIALLGGIIYSGQKRRLRTQKLVATQKQQLAEAQFRQHSIELELKALRAQINPHFFFNCMNSINRLILEGNSENATRYLSRFSRLVREILESSENDLIPLNMEIQMLTNYVGLEQLRFKDQIDFEINYQDIDPESIQVPPLIFQPVVENAIWHGLMNRKENQNGKIMLSFTMSGSMLRCLVEDNGAGREEARRRQDQGVYQSNSMGLKITEERIRLIASENESRDWITFTDLYSHGIPTGTQVEIFIPVSSDD